MNQNNKFDHARQAASGEVNTTPRPWVKPTFQAVPLNKALTGFKNLAIDDGPFYGS